MRPRRSRSRAGSRSRWPSKYAVSAVDVRGPARSVADRVQMDLDVSEPGVAIEAHPEFDDLCVDRRSGVADRLDVELPELTVATGLRTVVAEHRSGLGQLHWLRPCLHPVLDVGADDASRRFRPECPSLRFVGPWREPEEFLLDDVGDLADPALEHVGQFEQRTSRCAGSRIGRPGPRQAARDAPRSRSRAAAGRACRGASCRWASP